jgi:hypothetical protein
MRRLLPLFCWLILGPLLFPALAQSAEQAEKKLQGSWTATKAERDGKAVDDVVGNRLVLPVTASRSNQKTETRFTQVLSA